LNQRFCYSALRVHSSLLSEKPLRLFNFHCQWCLICENRLNGDFILDGGSFMTHKQRASKMRKNLEYDTRRSSLDERKHVQRKRWQVPSI